MESEKYIPLRKGQTNREIVGNTVEKSPGITEIIEIFMTKESLETIVIIEIFVIIETIETIEKIVIIEIIKTDQEDCR